MTSQKNDRGMTANSLPTLKIGSRVRCTDDGIEGRITWANGVSVKIQWDDGEQVTWRRDSLVGRPIDILDPTVADDATDMEEISADGETNVANNSPAEELTPPPVTETTVDATEPAPSEAVSPLEDDAKVPASAVLADAATEAAVTSKRRRNAPAVPNKQKKTSALEASVRVLAEAGQPLNCQEMIAAMSAKGYWSSPAGKTPAATLYSALLRELTTKGADSRFVKAERGKFALAKTL